MSTKAERQLALDVVNLRKELDAAKTFGMNLIVERNRALGERDGAIAEREARTTERDAALEKLLKLQGVYNVQRATAVKLYDVTFLLPIWIADPQSPTGGFFTTKLLTRKP